jgi:UDP-glucuronate 4-epimerase
MKILITGLAGFIGHAVARRLTGQGHEIVGIDNLNDYYDVALKRARLADLTSCLDIRFIQLDLADRESMAALFAEERFERVIHLAAQAGVRYSLENPHVYADSNLTGHLNVLEGCRHHGVGHLVYASSSSVYGMNDKAPFATADAVDHPISLYAATKKANELMSHTYAHLYGIPTTGLRFFTVYGPWGRPDMAPFKFTRALLAGEPIQVFNHGDMQRDFTYIDDIVEGVVRILDVVPSGGADRAAPDRSTAPYALYNIGNGSPVALMDFIHAIETATGREAVCDFQPMQPGDVPKTWADTEALFQATGYRPHVCVEQGVARFVEWYRKFYGV